MLVKLFISEIVHTEDSFLLKLYYKFNFATEPKFSYYKSKNLLPIVEEVSKGLVTLPLHNRLSINDVKRVCTIISKSIQEWREQ
ncbi:dTDP-4-amino-4,6-dideoxygalactose transaminase [Staphylococcus epidermidis]